MPDLALPRRQLAYALPAFLIATVLVAMLTTRNAGAAEENWHVYVADAVVDTLDASLDQAHLAGQWVLTSDHWTIERNEPGKGELVTKWKPIKHPLVRLVAGTARVRVAVALRAAGAGRTEVRVLGGIATQANLDGGPVLPMAQAAGQKECRGYVQELKARLADLRTADGAPSGAPRSAPAAATR